MLPGEIVTRRDTIEGPKSVIRKVWKQDPDGVRANILAVARETFAACGLSGARIEDIASRTDTSKRMIYYYFGDKNGLYRAVLEDAYAMMRREEDQLDLASLEPVEALRRLTEFTFDHHREAESFVRLVMIENIHGAQNMDRSTSIAGANSSAIRHLEDVYARGCAAGSFRTGLTALELHWHISALCYFNVSNRPTFSRIFGNVLHEPNGQERLRQQVSEGVVRLVQHRASDDTPPASPTSME